jgi:5'(3')-deoxyribonucleotidase
MNNYDYPEGADITSAPWNQENLDTELIEVTISQTFSKQLEIEVDDYETIKDSDEDGVYFWNDYSGCNLKEYVEEQHKTITDILKEIPELYETFSKLDLSNKKEVELFKHSLLILSEACKDWSEDEMEVVQ